MDMVATQPEMPTAPSIVSVRQRPAALPLFDAGAVQSASVRRVDGPGLPLPEPALCPDSPTVLFGSME